MKLRKILFGLSPIVLTLGTVSTTLTGCGSKQTDKLPEVSKHTTKDAFINRLYQLSSGRLYYATSEYGAIEVHNFNKSKITYVNVDDYVNYMMQFKDLYPEDDAANYKSETKDYKTTITNLNNNATCVIDYKQQTLVFSDYDVFSTIEKEYTNNPLAHGCGGGEKYFIKDSKTGNVYQNSNYKTGGEYTIDLSAYNIVAYYDDNKGYLPYDLYRNILNDNPRCQMFFNGVNFYEICPLNNVYATDLYKEIAEESTILTSEYMEYCYNLLALTLDHKFGLYERKQRAAENRGKTKTYFAEGAYKALEPYKAALTSLDNDMSNDALCQMFADLCDDGGHAGYTSINLLTTRPHARTRGPESQVTQDVFANIANAREAIKTTDPVAPEDYWESRKTSIFEESPAVSDNYIHLYNRDGDKPILYITFDGFNYIEYYTSARELEKGKVYYDDVKIDVNETGKIANENYMLDTIRMTMGADKFIKEYNKDHVGKEIKNVVVDLSENGGGTVCTEYFLASWLCGGVSQKGWNPNTKAYGEFEVQADVNGDGVFDENDYLPKDTNLFCITSDGSFSCGNALPCNIADCRTANTYFIGSPSGGGACFVDSNMHIGLGNVFRSSSNFHILRKGSTQENPISVDDGHLPDPASGEEDKFFYYIASTTANATKFVDRAAINQKIIDKK